MVTPGVGAWLEGEAMIKQIATVICLFACIAPVLAGDEKDKETHAETSVLQALPAEVQKNIEEVRTACREYWNNIGADPSQPISPLEVAPRVSSGDDGLILFTVSGTQAVMVSNLALCGGQCLKGAVSAAGPRHGDLLSPPSMPRHFRPSFANSASASLGPALPAG
jgi:hypothetical protein